MKRFSLLLFLAAGCLLPSCTQFLYLTMGMHHPKMLSDKQLQHYSRKRKIPESHSFYADTLLLNFIVEQKKHPLQIKNHVQPLQAIWFQRTDPYPLAWSINCYANPRTFRLRWDALGEMDSLPPKGNAPLDSLLMQQDLQRFVKPVFFHSQTAAAENEYNVYVLYNRLMNRGSRHLMRAVRTHEKRYKGRVVIQYVNTDRLYAGTDFDTEK